MFGGLFKVYSDVVVVYYRCLFYPNRTGDNVSSPADNIDDTTLVCVTPAWTFPAGVGYLSIMLKESRTLVPFVGTDSSQEIFTFEEKCTGILSAQGPAGGMPSSVQFAGYGYGKPSEYACDFTRGSQSKTTTASAISDGSTRLSCPLPQWGKTYVDSLSPFGRRTSTAPSAPVNVSLRHNGTSLVIDTIFETLYGPQSQPTAGSSAKLNKPICSSAACSFAFYAVWESFALNVSETISAGGQQGLVVSGAGFSTNATYVCRFLAADGYFAQSDVVTATNASSLTCTTPKWQAATRNAKLVLLVGPNRDVVPYAGNASADGSSEAGRDIVFSAELRSVSPTSALAKGGETLTVIGEGFVAGMRCLFSVPGGSVSPLYTTALRVNTSEVRCETPQWYGRNLTVEFSMLHAGGASVRGKPLPFRYVIP
jgi:hypothetical protein